LKRRFAGFLVEGSPHGSPPLFFVSVAFKGFILAVSLLFATLAERCINVAAKGLEAIACRDPERVGTFGPDRVGVCGLKGRRSFDEAEGQWASPRGTLRGSGYTGEDLMP
jgi:hypothetical protein